jgi:hypothetical protein
VIHMKIAMAVPTANCTVVMFIGYGKTFRTCQEKKELYKLYAYSDVHNLNVSHTTKRVHTNK